MRPRKPLLTAAWIAVATLASSGAQATVVGTILSGPTTADPLAAFWNPAAMTLMRGTQTMLFGGLAAIRAQYERSTPSGFDGSVFPQAELVVPKPDLALGVVTDATLERFRFGLAFTVPVLDGASWEPTYGGKPSSTRYFAIRGRLVHFDLRAAVAYRINRYVSVGLGLDVIAVWLEHDAMTDFGAKVNQMACQINSAACLVDAPLAREDPALDARTTVNGVGYGLGVAAGVLISPRPWLRVGLSFQSGGQTITVPVKMKVEIPGTVKDFVAAKLPTLKLPALTAVGEVETVSPMAFAVGVSIQPLEKIEIAADFHWMQKSKMSEMVGNIKEASSSLISDQVLIKALSDDWTLGLRGSYQLRPWLSLALRLEYDPDSRPERFVTPVSIDYDKIQIQIGAAIRISRRVSVVADYGKFLLFSREIHQSNFAPNADPKDPVAEGLDKPHPLGRYTGQVDRFGVGVQVGF